MSATVTTFSHLSLRSERVLGVDGRSYVGALGVPADGCVCVRVVRLQVFWAVTNPGLSTRTGKAISN
ncbi:hypothetical protein DPMN_009569 [Dreissena polymorpha]|uniref:Uncharacterized protein n=1 Tax=Dreissena polymorpha TaxID=45954 RepID=A0A9D4N1I1_DREPO|nr:hypothetical protein DPMN_009569 [Dreissena polymorpha]